MDNTELINRLADKIPPEDDEHAARERVKKSPHKKSLVVRAAGEKVKEQSESKEL